LEIIAVADALAPVEQKKVYTGKINPVFVENVHFNEKFHETTKD
jgi:hypothetical protein